MDSLQTWSDARQYCRDRYADLFTWRDNKDEQFIEPMFKSWFQSAIFLSQKVLVTQNNLYVAWAGAKITSFNRE